MAWTGAARGWTSDLRQILRGLIKSPGFTTVAVLSLAIGIGLNTAVFGVVRASLLEPLPVPRPHDLRLVYERRPSELKVSQYSSSGYSDPGGPSYGSNFSYPTFRKLQAAAGSTAEIFGFNFTRQLNVAVDDQPPIVVGGSFASGNYFRALGVRMAAGRGLLESDDRPDSSPVAVLSYGLWMRFFGGDRAVIGRTLRVNGVATTIVGVTEPRYVGLSAGGFFLATDVTIPFAAQPSVVPSWGQDLSGPLASSESRWWVRLMARLQPGATDADLERALTPVFQTTLRDSGLATAAQAAASSVRSLPGFRGLETLRRDLRTPLTILSVVVAVALLIACVNLASLLLSRGVGRQREFWVRRALGASAWRVSRHLLLESAVLAAAGGGVGLLLAWWSQPVFGRMLADGLGPAAFDLSLDWPVLGACGAATLLATLACGMLPAIRFSRASSMEHGRHQVLGASAPRLTMGRLLIAIQIGVSLPLVFGAALFLRTLQNLTAADLGFNPRNLVVFQVAPPAGARDDARARAFFDELLARMNALPGGSQATLMSVPLLGGLVNSSNVTIGTRRANTLNNPVGPGFFSTLGMSIVAGRTIGAQDRVDSPSVAVINETAAKQWFANAAIGQHVTMGSKDFEVVGVVRDSKYDSVRKNAQPTLFWPFAQQKLVAGQGAWVAVRTALPPASAGDLVRRTVAEIDRSVAVTNLRTQADQIDETIGKERVFTEMFAMLGGLALLLAIVGLHGVTSYTVARRTSEIGLRLALGAQRNQVLWLVLRQVVTLAAAGLAVGIPAALALSPLVGSLLFGLSPADRSAIVVSAAIMLAVSVAAGLLPAIRAARLPALTALRAE